MSTSAPFFIVGASRSGTTLLRLMLNAHSRLAVPDELKYFRHVETTFSLDAWREDLSDAAYRHLVRSYLERRADVFPDTTQTLEAMLLAIDERTLRGPYRALLAHAAQQQGKARWGEKTPHNMFYVDVLHAMFPDAQFIHVVRDPRAVVQSMNASHYYSEETIFNALNWRMSVREGERLFRAHLPADQLYTVRYEDLVRTPESALRSITDVLGEAFEPQMLRFYETAGTNMASQIRTPAITKPVSRASLSKWTQRLAPSEVFAVEQLCAAEMARLGYERTTAPSRMRLWRALPKFLYWQWKTWQHRDQRGYEVEYPFLARTWARHRPERHLLSP